jgi:DNA-binding transcriptional LysR family regulator
MKRIDLNHLRVFAMVVKHGNFTRAAEALGVVRSSICRRVSSLEHELGAKLLEVDTRHVSITDFGNEFYRHCECMMEAADKAFALVESVRSFYKAGFVTTRVDPGSLPATSNQVRQIVREELRRLFPQEMENARTDNNDHSLLQSTQDVSTPANSLVAL